MSTNFSQTSQMATVDGNEAVALIAHKLSDVIAVYPITPSSPMGEFCDQWSAEGKVNLWNTVPCMIEMQSEGGASGALHGALQTGALATTFTASQGLLLMIPNMYKIAGELMSTVLHVSARSLACQGLSIFGDHSDVMAARATGFAMLCSSSVQEAHDMALISHLSTLESRVPFLHFFDGFRTSHEVSKIETISDEQIKSLLDDDLVFAHRRRSMSPDNPFIRGTAQNPDVYFQGRETVNPFYDLTLKVVERNMRQLEKVTGRSYHLVDYFGAKDAERVIVLMGSGTDTVRETVDYLNSMGQKLGVIQVHLYRPFPVEAFIEALPATTKAIAVLDRTKEPGSNGEPLYQDICTVLLEASSKNQLPTKNMPRVIGGRYGLSSKEFTPAMVKRVYDELSKSSSKNHFTVGIKDDVSFTSLDDYEENFVTEGNEVVRAVFFGLGSDGTVGANKNSIKIIGDLPEFYVQGYFVYDSKKAGSRTVSHLRFGPKPIRSSYLIQSANFVGVHQFNFLEKIDVLKYAAPNATLLINTTYSSEEVWEHFPLPVQQSILQKNLKVYVIDAYKVAREAEIGSRINTVMQTCFFGITQILPIQTALNAIKYTIKKSYQKKGQEIVDKNNKAVDHALTGLRQVIIPQNTSPHANAISSPVNAIAPEFVKEVTAKMMIDEGDSLPVSAMPIDGTFPVGTTKWEKRNVSLDVSVWNKDLCIQCGRCSLICPHGVIRSLRYPADKLQGAPASFKSCAVKMKGAENERFTLQTYVEDCTGCGLCVEICPAKDKQNPSIKGINLTEKEPILKEEQENIAFFESLGTFDVSKLDTNTVRDIQYIKPYFEFSGACAGCGETPYVKLVSQLFGDRLLVANATGCSSIYGGNLPTTPWCTDENGRGPTWANSLFEDNAEFGLGFRVSEDKHTEQALELLESLSSELGASLVEGIKNAVSQTTSDQIQLQRERIVQLKNALKKMDNSRASHLLSLADYLVKHSVWIMGGDGWAYDIGYGGLDHVLSTNYDVNVLVMDNEVYANTGGQASKSTPIGAIAKFATNGKESPKKNLGLIAMTYGNVYVAQISLGANQNHALKAIKEAEAYPGPSLILAYVHCISHGIDMRNGLTMQQMAVDCGAWPLFRYNPLLKQEGKNPFTLDSKKPSIPFSDYAKRETRFKAVAQMNPEAAARFVEREQAHLDEMWSLYEKMAND